MSNEAQQVIAPKEGVALQDASSEEPAPEAPQQDAKKPAPKQEPISDSKPNGVDSMNGLIAPSEQSDDTQGEASKDSHSQYAIMLLRNIHMHNVMLSDLADRKANFMLAATTVSLSIIISTDVSDMRISFAVICVFALAVAILAVLTILPRYSKKTVPTPNSDDENLFFFGSFGNKDFQSFYKDVDPILRSTEEVHKALCKDIYGIGTVLQKKKYFYLGWSYRIFAVGLCIIPLVVVIETQLLK